MCVALKVAARLEEARRVLYSERLLSLCASFKDTFEGWCFLVSAFCKSDKVNSSGFSSI